MHMKSLRQMAGCGNREALALTHQARSWRFGFGLQVLACAVLTTLHGGGRSPRSPGALFKNTVPGSAGTRCDF